MVTCMPPVASSFMRPAALPMPVTPFRAASHAPPSTNATVVEGSPYFECPAVTYQRMLAPRSPRRVVWGFQGPSCSAPFTSSGQCRSGHSSAPRVFCSTILTPVSPSTSTSPSVTMRLMLPPSAWGDFVMAPRAARRVLLAAERGSSSSPPPPPPPPLWASATRARMAPSAEAMRASRLALS